MSGVCRFYMAGFCRYGDRCRFQHTYASDENYYYDDQNYKQRQQKSTGYSGVSILRSSGQSSFSSNINQTTNSNYNVGHHNQNYNTNYNNNNQRMVSQGPNLSEVLNIALKEIELLESGHHWLLTCFCPLKETSIAPGWIDFSPEELRCEIYKASKDGTFENCKLLIQQLFKEAQDRRNEFRYREKGLAVIESMLQNKRDGNACPSNAVLNTNIFQYDNTSSGIPNIITPFGIAAQPSVQIGSAFTNLAQPNIPVQNQQTSRIFNDPAPLFSFSLNQNSTASTVNNTVTTPFPPQVFQTEANNSIMLNSNSAPSVVVDDNANFSRLSDLTESELSVFQAKTFTFGQIPLKPPPIELCQH